jgi:uncharacterized protein HemY
MKRIQLDIKDKAYDKFVNLLNQFNKEDIKIIEQIEYPSHSKEYNLSNKKTAMVSETTTENLTKKTNVDEQNQDWWKDLSTEEKKEIKIGLDQANKGNLIDNDTVMNRFKKWH